MATLPLYVINAFTDPQTPRALYKGNPAATIVETEAQSRSISDAQRQALARELNLSETSFVTRTDEPLTFRLRWFTPLVEVALCGHATLAAAQALLKAGLVERGDVVTFETRKAGKLEVVTFAEESRLQMRFPLLDHRDEMKKEVKSQVCEVLDVREDDVEDMYKSDYDLVLLLKTEDMVAKLRPDFKRLTEVETRGLMVAAPGEKGGFVSRFFAPRVGIDEDPVTGSAHCVLAAVYVKDGETVTARQISERGGVLVVGRRGRTVELSGDCRTFVKGEVLL